MALEPLPTLVAHQGKQVFRGRPRGFRSFEDLTPSSARHHHHPLFSPSVHSSSVHLLSEHGKPEEARARELFNVPQLSDDDTPDFEIDLSDDPEDSGPIVCHLCLCIGHFQARCPVRQCEHCQHYGKHGSCPARRRQQHRQRNRNAAPQTPERSKAHTGRWNDEGGCNSHGKSRGFESFGSNRKYKQLHKRQQKHQAFEKAQSSRQWKHKSPPAPVRMSTSRSTRPPSRPSVRRWRPSSKCRSPPLRP